MRFLKIEHVWFESGSDIVILGELLIAKATEALMPALSVLMDADSFAFFESTIGFFIEFKAHKNSPEWIWERVCNNEQDGGR